MAAEPNQKKVVVNFQSVANAPKLRQSKFKIGGNEKFAKVIEFLRCQIHQDTVFLYVNSVFSPNPDELINDFLEEKYRNSVLAKFAIRSSPSDPETTTRI
ncbi:hypothetical protein BRADI_1g46420v3 [Brachypodium distachyon]|uniref:Ubiquitin-like protein ATG12 n=1 Tax=Brachypodium distachyon TaxID=15368 RepID=A0A0Q3NNJ5_BRADI|nr:hypothetical protein BRADI_1g46420v3 [Brachypodium distachyon]